MLQTEQTIRVDKTFENVLLKGQKLLNCATKNCVIVDCTINNCVISGCEITNSTIKQCRIKSKCVIIDTIIDLNMVFMFIN